MPHASPLGIIGQQADDAVRKSGGVVERNDKTGLTVRYDPGVVGHVGGDDGNTAGHRFQKDVRRAFV